MPRRGVHRPRQVDGQRHDVRGRHRPGRAVRRQRRVDRRVRLEHQAGRVRRDGVFRLYLQGEGHGRGDDVRRLS